MVSCWVRSIKNVNTTRVFHIIRLWVNPVFHLLLFPDFTIKITLDFLRILCSCQSFKKFHGIAPWHCFTRHATMVKFWQNLFILIFCWSEKRSNRRRVQGHRCSRRLADCRRGLYQKVLRRLTLGCWIAFIPRSKRKKNMLDQNFLTSTKQSLRS